MIGQVGSYGTDKPLENNYVGSALSEVENQGFKYRAEQRLAEDKKKEDDDAKLQKLNEWNKSVKADLTGFNSVDFPVKEYLMRIKQEGGKLTQDLNNSSLPLNDRLKAMGQRDALVSSIDFLKQMPVLLNSSLADLHEGVKSGKYDKESEDRALETVKAIQSGDFKIDPTTGNPVVTVWKRDEKGNAVNIIADKQPFGDFIKNNLQPDLKSNLEEQISKYHLEYPASSTKTTNANGTTIFHKGIDPTKGSKDWNNATEKAVGILSNEPELKRASKKYKLPITDVDGIASKLRDDLLNGVPTQDENIKDANLAFQKYKFSKEQKKDEEKDVPVIMQANKVTLTEDIQKSKEGGKYVIDRKGIKPQAVTFKKGIPIDNIGGESTGLNNLNIKAVLINDKNEILFTGTVLDTKSSKNITGKESYGSDFKRVTRIASGEIEGAIASKMGFDSTDELKSYLNDIQPKKQSQTTTQQNSQVPTYSKADLKSNGWSDAQIQQAIKLGKIKVN